MPSKKGRPEPRWLVIVEEIRAQNRSTIEAVEASRVAMEERLDRFEQRTEDRFRVVEAAAEDECHQPDPDEDEDKGRGVAQGEGIQLAGHQDDSKADGANA